MRAAVRTATTPSTITPLLSRLNDKYFADMPLSPERRDRVVAQYFRSRLTSVFQPLVEADGGACVGHQGLVRVRGRGGDWAAPWTLFSHDVDAEGLVKLDRLCRTLHAVNYFGREDAQRSLFLNIESRLLTGVAADHGAYFESVLALLGISPARVVIVMPADAIDNPVAFVRSAISYRVRGFRVLVPVRANDAGDLSHVFLAGPDFASVDLPEALREGRMAALAQALRANGIRPVARRIESARDAAQARDAGFELLQGYHLGRP
jgi:EAL domain-containing protein (putative c-di-GMP-specific phosphodiesterase class I)